MVAWFVRVSVSHSVDFALDQMVDQIPLGVNDELIALTKKEMH